MFARGFIITVREVLDRPSYIKQNILMKLGKNIYYNSVYYIKIRNISVDLSLLISRCSVCHLSERCISVVQQSVIPCKTRVISLPPCHDQNTFMSLPLQRNGCYYVNDVNN